MPSQILTGSVEQELGRKVEELRLELDEAHRREAATAEVLRVISRSVSEAEPVFDIIARSALRLVNAQYVCVMLYDGEVLHLAAVHNSNPEAAETIRRSFPRQPDGSSSVDRAIRFRGPVQIPDVLEDPTYELKIKNLGFRSILSVPMLRNSAAIGAIAVGRDRPGQFSEKQIALLQTFADQAVIAIENTRLFEEVQQKNAALNATNSQLTETLEQQTATSEILKVIASSPSDVQPVFDAIVAAAPPLVMGGVSCAVRLLQGDTLHVVAWTGLSKTEVASRGLSIHIGSDPRWARLVRDKRPIAIADLESDISLSVEHRDELRKFGVRSALVVPLLQDGLVIGAISVGRAMIGPFAEHEIRLLRTFADQAVIAIENTRLFEEVQARTRELTEALEQQTATSEVLSVISSSHGELDPVFRAMLENATRICDATFGMLWLSDGDGFRAVALQGVPLDLADERKREPLLHPAPELPLARLARTKQLIHITDINMDQSYLGGHRPIVALADLGGARAFLLVPMLKENELVGALAIYRQEVRPFTDKQIELVKSFASQAVIAIENTRLLKELRESLEQQTATADVLKAISRSALDLQSVLNELVSSASELCEAPMVAIHVERNGSLPGRARHGFSPEVVDALSKIGQVWGRGSLAGRTITEGNPVHIPDVAADTEYTFHDFTRVTGARSMLGVPLLRDGKPAGLLSLYRTRAAPFTSRQIDLMATFADQAVIAIENARLFEEVQARTRELQESLEYQTATSDVLNIISRSKFDLQPVLDSIIETAARLCECDMAAIRRRDGDVLVHLSGYGLPADYAEYSSSASWHLDECGSVVGRVLQEGKAVQVRDVLADPDYTHDEAQHRGGFRTILGVPLLRGGDQIGIIVLMRRVVQPFSDKQIELITAFADQVVIAIENTRLFEEVQARTRELAKTVENLEIASQHKSQFVANMSHELRTPLAAILGYAELIQEGFYGFLPEKSMDALTRIRSNGKHLLGLINTVLDIAKIESGQFNLNLCEYTIESVVETVRAATEALAETKKLALKTEVDKSLPVGLGDEQRLTQVLLNLVGNAIKFTDRGEVRVSARAVNGHFAVSVMDTGPGIPEQERVRIFEQFHQVDSSLTKSKGGTGLGLAIAKQIVEMHGGRIWVESTLGKGSTFQMVLPTRAELAREPPDCVV